MANISSLLEIIRTAHLGRDMRQALHDAIEDVNDDTETALGKTLAFDDTTRKLTLKAKNNSVLSEATIPGGTSGSTVSWNQIKQSGEKIATITIDNTSTDVYASAGGGGGGGAVDSVNGMTGDVVLDADDISDTNTTNKFVTATEKSTWNGKQDALTFTSTPSSSNKVVCQNDLPSGGGHTIKNESGTALTQRDNLQFKGCSVSDDSTNNATVVSVQTSNRNLLDNAWFTVNQKGVTSGVFDANTYQFDRWKTTYSLGGTNSLWSLSTNGLTLDNTNGASYPRFFQPFATDLDSNKTYTASILFSDGTIESVSGTPNLDYTTSKGIRIYCMTTQIQIQVASAVSATIRAVKLELGSTSTLAFDTAPDYTTELLKCQRYLQPINAYTVLCRSPRAATTWWGVWNLPVPFRVAPTLTVTSQELDLFTSSSYAEELNPTINMTVHGNTINLVVQSTASGREGSSATLMMNGWLDAQL